MNWENIGRLILVPIQALIRLAEMIGGILTRAAVETGICVVLYSLWYLDAHPNGNLDLAVKIGLWQVFVQAFHYSKWQFINRTLEPVLIQGSAGTMVKLRVAFGKAFVQFIKLFASVAISTTEYLTKEDQEPVKKQMSLLPAAKEVYYSSSEPAIPVTQTAETAETTVEVEAPEVSEVPASPEVASDATDEQT